MVLGVCFCVLVVFGLEVWGLSGVLGVFFAALWVCVWFCMYFVDLQQSWSR